jgi:glutathione S-transferase
MLTSLAKLLLFYLAATHQTVKVLTLSMKMSSSTTSSTSSTARFITNKMCPFAQKAWIALETSGASYKLEQVSLYGPGGKPDWFWSLNPKGEVPILVVDEKVFPDSDLILDEIQCVADSTGILYVPSIDDQETIKKIKKFRTCLGEFLPIGKSAVLGGSKEKMWSKLQQLDSLIEGPYIAGKQITIADCAGFPFLWRIDNEYGTQWEKHGCPNIPKWLEECSEQPSFSTTIQRSWWWWW